MATNSGGQRQAQRVGITLSDKLRDALVEAQRGAQIAVEDAFPVAEILLAERRVEAVGVAGGGDVGGGRAFAQHLRMGSPGTRWIRRKTRLTTSQITGSV